jgi:hypothetical protein
MSVDVCAHRSEQDARIDAHPHGRLANPRRVSGSGAPAGAHV